MSDDPLALIRTRRVVRALTDEPVERAQLERILEAASHAPSAGNRRLQRFVAVEDAATLRVLRMVAPGMLQRPTAAIVIFVDVAAAVEYGFAPGSRGLYIDVGTAAQTMLLAAHALGLGSGPVTTPYLKTNPIATTVNGRRGIRPIDGPELRGRLAQKPR